MKTIRISFKLLTKREIAKLTKVQAGAYWERLLTVMDKVDELVDDKMVDVEDHIDSLDRPTAKRRINHRTKR